MGKFRSTSLSFTPLRIWLKIKQTTTGTCYSSLSKYTRGQAQKLVKSCEYMSPTQGYQKAKQLLKENFGNKYKISCAYLEKVLSWPQIKSEDSRSLLDYAMFLGSSCNAMEETEYMEELDTISSIRSIVLKLPYKLREKWRSKPYELQEERSRRVRILDLVHFIEKQAQMAADPAFGDLQDQTTVKGKVTTKTRPPAKPQITKSSGSSFVTGVTVAPKEKQSEPPETPCSFCNCKHALEVCKAFMAQTHRNKLNFLKCKGMCFGCLSTGHISRGCGKHLTCRVCKQAHPSVLHINIKASGLAGKTPRMLW